MTALHPPFAPAPYPPQQPNGNYAPQPPMSFDSATGQPIYTPVAPVAPQIVGYDPATGQPIYAQQPPQYAAPQPQPAQYAPGFPPQQQYTPQAPTQPNPFDAPFTAPVSALVPIFGNTANGDLGAILGSIDWGNVHELDTRLLPLNSAQGIPVDYEGVVTKAEMSTDRSGGPMVIVYVKPTFPLGVAKEYAGLTIRNNSTFGEKAQGIAKSWLRACGFLSSDGKQCLLRNVQEFVGKHVRFRVAHNENPQGSGLFFNQIAGGVTQAFETPGLSAPVAAAVQQPFIQPYPQAPQPSVQAPAPPPMQAQAPAAPMTPQPPQVAAPSYAAPPQAPQPPMPPQQFAAPIPPGVPNFGQG